MIAGIGIFITCFILITLEKINKTIIALLGAVLFIILGIIDQDTAFAEIDWNVIFLLIGMMVIVGITKNTGIFQYAAIKTAKAVKGEPIKILLLFAVLSAVFSAILDNVTTVMILTPVIILVAVELGLSPIPFVISSAIASNIGGTATLIGDPPNIMIGSAAGLGFMDFIIYLGPIVLINFIIVCFIIYLLFRKKLKVSIERRARIMEFDEKLSIKDPALLVKCLIVLALVIIGFLIHDKIGLKPATIALFGAALLMLLSGGEEVDKFFHEVEWGTIFFFIGLFILVGGLVELGVIEFLSISLLNLTKGDIALSSQLIIWLSGVMSAIVDNIPYVATMIPMVEHMGETLGSEAIQPIWWSLALGSCFGGNGTLIGASANVVGAGIAGKNGYKISFLEFTKYSAFITVITLIVSSIYVYFRF
ncbi:MAG: ArsB/NhaD family transporter [Spirochaetales bacterium]|nr:ArsB/NhaD family transporter [Spirochaetales bacterium]